MKPRFYKRNVIDGDTEMHDMTIELIRSHRKHVIGYALALVLLCIVNLWVACTLAKTTSFAPASLFLVPVIVVFAVRGFQYLSAEREWITILKIDRNSYEGWMTLHRTKVTEDDRLAACRLIKQYRNTYQECHVELLELLRENLKQKPANQLIVSVAAGLVFLKNDRGDYQTLFNAKYRHGAAGNMIPDIWLRTLDPKQPENVQQHAQCAEQFLTYWDNQIKSIAAGQL